MNAPADRSPHRMRVLIALDQSEPAEWAFDVGATIAQNMDAKVLLVHVVPPPATLVAEFVVVVEDLDLRNHQAGEALLSSFAERLPPPAETKRMMRTGTPANEILIAARVWAADLIVLGTRGRLAQLLPDSTTETVVRRARCPVVTVGHPADWAELGWRHCSEAAVALNRPA